jgi:NhaP-type Na+/H+ or K+/H+ antiporter
MSEDLIINLVTIVALGIGAQWLAWRLGIPSIILLLAAGFTAGPILGLINPSQAFGDYLNQIIALSVAVILFEGGLNLRWHEYREAGIDVIRLISIGVVLTWALSSAAAHYIGTLSWPIAMIFGAIIVVTGPTVIMPLLKEARLKRRPASLLKWEGIINDPLGALLAVLVFEYFVVSEHTSILTDIVGTLGLSLITAIIAGVIVGYLLGWSFLHGQVPDYLMPPVMLVTALILYVSLNLFQEEAGLLAVTTAGLVLANQRLRNIDELRRFKEYITVMLVSVVFIVLTADIDPVVLKQLDWHSAALLAIIIFIIRPAVVYVATLGSGMDWRERLLTGWIAPRGVVAAAIAGLFATRLAEKGYPGSDKLLPLVFTLIAATVILHGSTIGWLARRLGLAAQSPNGLLIVGASPWSIDLAHTLKDLEIPCIISDTSWNHLQAARMSGVQSHHGEILSVRAEETLDLNEISHLLAATANDAYNALVCNRFAQELGRNQVFQLPSFSAEEKNVKEMPRTMRGRIAFSGDSRYEDLIRYHYQGWKFHSTRIGQEYSLDEFVESIPQESILIMVIKDNGEIKLIPNESKSANESTHKAGSGDYIISYRPPAPRDSDHRSEQNGNMS